MYMGFLFKLILMLSIKPSIFQNSYKGESYALLFNDNSVNEGGRTGTNSSEWISENENYNNVTCIEPGHEKICSGHGECRSGICKCDSLKPLENATGYLYEYSGKFCEECPYCKGQRCHKLLPCVQSLMRNLTDNRCDINYNLVENLQLKYNDKLCQVEDDRGCMMSFKYFYDDNASLYVDLERKVKCLNGKKYIMVCWCIFLIYIMTLMIILKML